MTKTKHECPLCGKTIQGEDEDLLCSDCRNSVDNQYKSDFLTEEESTESINNSHTDPNFSSSHKKKKKPVSIIIFVSVCILVTIFGIIASFNVSHLREDHIAEDTYWKKCLETNIVLSYSKYLVAYPDGKYVDEANNQIQKLKDDVSFEWNELKKESDINDILLYIKNNPDSKYIDSAKFLADSISWTNALNLDNLDAISTYLSSVKLGVISGFHSELANDRYDYLSSIRQLDSISLSPVKSLIESLYVNLKMNDTIALNAFFQEKIVFNQDSIERKNLLITFLQRQQSKDSLITYTPHLSSLSGTIDRDSTLFINYVEVKAVEPKPIKNNKKKHKIVVNKLYTDSVAIVIKRPNQISNILFR